MTRHRRGFTLIELLIVVVIIGVLAAIAVPKFQNSKGRAFGAAIKSDLHNLATAQESYFYETSTYTSDTAQLKYNRSPGVTVEIVSATAAGWGATATHPAAYPLVCALYMGNVSPVAPATQEGQINCQ